MREPLLILIVGAPGSGKTTLAKGLITAARTRGERIAILDENGELGGDWPGYDGIEDWCEQIRTMPSATRPTLIWLDDADNYIPHPLPKKDTALKNLFTRNRHWRVDVIITARRIQNMPPQVVSASRYIYLFRPHPWDVTAVNRVREGYPGPLPQVDYEFVRLSVVRGEAILGRVEPDGSTEPIDKLTPVDADEDFDDGSSSDDLREESV